MQDRIVYMPPLPNKCRVPISYEVRSIENKPGTANGLRRGRLNSNSQLGLMPPTSPHPPFSPSANSFQTRAKGIGANGGGGGKATVEKRIITFGALDDFRSVPEDRASLSIEGNRTGEEVVIEQQAPRKPSEAPPADLSALRRQLAQAKTEVRTLAGKLQKKKAELEMNRNLMQHFLDELSERRKNELEYLHDREDKVFTHLIAPLQGNDSSTALREFEAQVKSLEKQLQDQKDAFEEERKALAKQLADAQNIPRNDGELEKLKARVAELEALLESERSRFSREKQILEAEKSGVELVLSQTAQQLHDLEVVRAEEEFLVAQSRQFVKNVCQPGFNVVKDASLEPVEKNRSSPTGYVLVPLIILLHGYTLLPNTEREEVITSYERRAAAL